MATPPLDRQSDVDSFWECVEVVCRRVARRADIGQYPLGATTAARAKAVLDMLDQMKPDDEDGMKTKGCPCVHEGRS